MSIFSERLKKLRHDNNLSQHKLSDKLNIPRATLASWEIGTRSPELKNVEMVASFFDVSIDYLLGKIDVRRPLDIKGYLRDISNLINNDLELADFIQKLIKQKELQQICKIIKDLPSDSINRLIKIAKALEE